jgi:hypothetical protein
MKTKDRLRQERPLKKTGKLRGICIVLLMALIAALPIHPTTGDCNIATQAGSSASSPLTSFTTYSAEADANFSIIWITDTQYLSESHPTYYDSLCRWIVDNADVYNVKMVIHTGDMVEDEFNQTHWANANKSMSILLNAGIPYCWNAGNHDYNTTYWVGNQFSAFNPAVMAEKSYWAGDKFDGQNTAVHFPVSDWEFLIINIAYQANDTALAWANDLLDAHPESHAIVAAHIYLNGAGEYGTKGKDDSTWPLNFKANVLDNHANVFLALSAHYYPTSGSRTKVGDRDELMFNRQDKDSQMGAASLRILTFDRANGTIDVKTFYIYANIFLTDSNNQFTLNTTFRNDAANSGNATDFGSLTVILAVLSVVIVAFILVVVNILLRRRHCTKEKPTQT